MASVVHPTLEAAGLPRPARVVRAALGIGNHVYFAGDVVVRVGTGTDGAKFPAALAVLRAAAGRVRVPAVLYEDVTRGRVAYPVMVLERLAGEPLSQRWPELEQPERMAVLEGVMAELERLHAIPADLPEPWWQRRVVYIERELRRHREGATFPAAWLGRMERYLDDHHDALVSAPQVGVLHGDVSWGNVVVDGGRCGLIDFDETRCGPAEEDSWQVLFESGLDPAGLRGLPGFDLSSSGVLERFLLREIENICLLLSGTLSWKTPEEARQDAMETYHEAFETGRIARLLEQLA